MSKRSNRENEKIESTEGDQKSRREILDKVDPNQATLRPVERNRRLKHGTPNQNTSRRATIKGLFGGIGTIGLSSLISRRAKGSERIKITTKHKGEPIETKRVPRSWYEQVQVAGKTRYMLHREFSSERWYQETGQRASNDAIGDLYKHKIVAYVDDKSVAKRNLPSSANGIPVEISKYRKPEPDDHLSSKCDEHTGSQNCVMGGSFLDADDDCFSATGMAEYQNDDYLMTCAHTMGDCGNDHTGEPVYSGKINSNYIGDVFIYSWDYDWALVSPTSVNGLDNHIINENKRLLGYKTSGGCDTLISNYDAIHHEGVSTGRTTGWLDEKVTRDFVGCDQYSAVEYLKYGTEAGGGDSGGPHFHDTGGTNVVLLGPHSSHTSFDGHHSRSFGPAAYAINDTAGIQFGGSSPTC